MKQAREGYKARVSYFLYRNIAGFEGGGGSESEPFVQRGKEKERMSANRTARWAVRRGAPQRRKSRYQLQKNKRHREGVSYFSCKKIAGFEGGGGAGASRLCK